MSVATKETRKWWILIGGGSAIASGFMIIGSGGMAILLGLACVGAGIMSLWLSQMGTHWDDLPAERKWAVMLGVAIGFVGILLMYIIARAAWIALKETFKSK